MTGISNYFSKRKNIAFIYPTHEAAQQACCDFTLLEEGLSLHRHRMEVEDKEHGFIYSFSGQENAINRFCGVELYAVHFLIKDYQLDQDVYRYVLTRVRWSL